MNDEIENIINNISNLRKNMDDKKYITVFQTKFFLPKIINFF